MSGRGLAGTVAESVGGAGGPSLGHVLVELGEQSVEVLCAAEGALAARVGRTRIWDGGDGDPELGEGDLVLAVGVVAASPLLSRLLVAAAEAGVAAVALRGPVNLVWVRAEAEALGVTVLVVPRGLSWDVVHAGVRSLVAAAGPGEAADGPSALFLVANTAAAALGGPVEIDDAQMRLVAFSNLPGGLDELRTVSILTRLPPPAFTEWLERTGQLARLHRAVAPIRIDHPGSRPRLVVPVRAGFDLLGYVWLAEGAEPLGARHEDVLVEVARIVSAHLLRTPVGASDRRSHRELMVRALEGQGDTGALAAHLRLARDTEFELVALRPRRHWGDPAVDPLYVRDQLELRRELAAHGGAAMVLGGHVYGILPVHGGASAELAATVRETVSLVANQLGCELVAITGLPPVPLAGLAAVREQADRGLRLLADDPDRSVATADELRPRVTLALVQELARDHPELLVGPVEQLAEIDRTRRTDYLATLRAYFDTASDLSEAARVLFVHRNTLRYRLRRIQELCGLDLASPVDRLIAELQLRLLDDRSATAGPALQERASS